ncbi:hypothetical protein PFLUV_G00177710 [Xyrichtys novacula]|uniref:Uncharacterized protein n=1 Tax=Xyrichtys novacula TaxID=13765 RepID=A0AAV1GNE3_XYRNO|nr:hypothetical protein PFLUV_G00177710 [Xyrichtys novacula]
MDVRGCRAGTEVDEKQRRRARQDSGALCSYTRHWETHSNTFTHSHTDAAVHTSACFCPLPHRLALASWRAAPSPVQSWVSKLLDPLSASDQLTSEIDPPLLWTAVILRAIIHKNWASQLIYTSRGEVAPTCGPEGAVRGYLFWSNQAELNTRQKTDDPAVEHFSSNSIDCHISLWDKKLAYFNKQRLK